MKTQMKNKSVRGTFWTVALFYMLIAFEFFYMASPFAVYFYSVYKPGLNFLNHFKSLSWLLSFFFPHIINETSSLFVNMHNAIGAVTALAGFSGFCIGACQVYYNKLRKRGAVTGGIYNIIRHPQYVSLAVCSFGLLLLWPRFIVLIMFITMLFAYYILAKTEEKECEERFGQSYIDYKNKTNMFLPFKIPFFEKFPSLPETFFGKTVFIFVVYIITVSGSVFVSKQLQKYSLHSLYASYSEDSAYISVTKIDNDKLNIIIRNILKNKEVAKYISNAKETINTKFMNYILPAEWYVSEIPMNPVDNPFDNHFLVKSYDKGFYKIIFTKAELRNPEKVKNGRDILENLVKRIPVVEVWIDANEMKITAIKNPPVNIMYENIPVAVY